MKDFTGFELGVTAEPVALETMEDDRAAALALALQARRKIRIFTRDLDAPLYDNPPFAEALSALLLSTPQARLHILLQDSGRAVTQGHRLIELSRRFTSSVQVRRPPEEHQDFPEAFLIADDAGLLHRRFANRYEGTVDFAAPREARRLMGFFDEVWELSAPDPEMRALHL